MRYQKHGIHAALTRRSALGVLAAGGLALAGCGGDGGSDADDPLPAQMQARLQKVIDDNRTLYHFPGAQAGVWTRHGAWVGVTGVAQQGGNTPPARADHTRIGSVTKTFTVMMILQLADKGVIDLDDKIGQYVPGLPNGDSATLRMLASMTSGIPSYTFDDTFVRDFSSDPQRVFTPEQLLDYVRGKSADFPAGTRVEYSNSNTVALGLVVEQQAKMPFAQAIQEMIAGPLQLTQTLAPAAGSNAIPDPHWRGITVQGDPEGVVKDPTDWNPSWGFSAGEMISTLDDLHHWAVALGTGGGLISPKMQAIRMASINSPVPPNTSELSYALGFFDVEGWMGHNGDLPGFNTSILYDPKTETALVAMVNSDIGLDTNGGAIDINSDMLTLQGPNPLKDAASVITFGFITALNS